MSARRVFIWAWLGVVASLAATAAPAATDEFPVSDEQLTRLGVKLGAAETVDLVELAAVPAEVVVPPARQSLVSAPAGGVVARLLVAEGDRVAAGQPVAELDSVEFVERQRDYLDAVAAADLAAAQEARDRTLFHEGIIAERRVNESVAAERAARAMLDQARARLTLAGLEQLDLERLAADRRFATRIVLRAPFAGSVVAEHARIGARVDALDPVLAIADLRSLWLELRVPQESVVRVQPGQLVSVAVGGETLGGTVTTIGAVVDAATQSVLVRAAVDNASARLRAGQMLMARVLARPAGGVAYAVPAAAVTRNGGEALLFVRSGGDVIARRVEVLGDDGARVYVSSGIGADARVAVDGIGALKALWLATEEGS